MARTASAEGLGPIPLELDLDDEQQLLQDSTRGFLARHYPLEEARGILESERRPDPDGWARAAQMGWIAILAAEQLGGLDAGPPEATVVASELGRAVNWAPFLGNALSAAVLSGAAGGEGAVAADSGAGRLAARIVAGEASAAWCGPEPSGSEWGAETIQTVARPDGDGYRIDGVKRLVADADLAAELLVSARLDGHLTNFVVPVGTPGVELIPARTLDLTRRFPTVRLEGVRVGADQLAGEAGGATAAVRHGLDLGTVLSCADAVGAAERLLEMTVEYSLGRIAFERPIGSYQAVKHKCADMLLRVEACRAATRYAALSLGAGAPERTRAVAVAGAYVPDATAAIAGEALQIHGGIGFTWEHDLHLFLRRIKADEALFGDSTLHRERLAAMTL
jgi:alkylation response protein AidB-like acyl-CoA dehydrogenase